MHSSIYLVCCIITDYSSKLIFDKNQEGCRNHIYLLAGDDFYPKHFLQSEKLFLLAVYDAKFIFKQSILQFDILLQNDRLVQLSKPL